MAGVGGSNSGGGDVEMGGWSELLHSSTKLLEQAAPTPHFPPLQVRRRFPLPFLPPASASSSSAAAIASSAWRVPPCACPRAQRNLDQLEVLSTKLKAKTVRAEAPVQSLSATRSVSSPRSPPSICLGEARSAVLRVGFVGGRRLLGVYGGLRVLGFAFCRLLAREGINAEQLARDLKSFELKVMAGEGYPIS